MLCSLRGAKAEFQASSSTSSDALTSLVEAALSTCNDKLTQELFSLVRQLLEDWIRCIGSQGIPADQLRPFASLVRFLRWYFLFFLTNIYHMLKHFYTADHCLQIYNEAAIFGAHFFIICAGDTVPTSRDLSWPIFQWVVWKKPWHCLHCSRL